MWQCRYQSDSCRSSTTSSVPMPPASSTMPSPRAMALRLMRGFHWTAAEVFREQFAVDRHGSGADYSHRPGMGQRRGGAAEGRHARKGRETGGLGKLGGLLASEFGDVRL